MFGYGCAAETLPLPLGGGKAFARRSAPREGVPGRGNSRCKGPGAGQCWESGACPGSCQWSMGQGGRGKTRDAREGSRAQRNAPQPGSQETWVPVPPLPLVGSVTLGKSSSFHRKQEEFGLLELKGLSPPGPSWLP